MNLNFEYYLYENENFKKIFTEYVHSQHSEEQLIFLQAIKNYQQHVNTWFSQTTLPTTPRSGDEPISSTHHLNEVERIKFIEDSFDKEFHQIGKQFISQGSPNQINIATTMASKLQVHYDLIREELQLSREQFEQLKRQRFGFHLKHETEQDQVEALNQLLSSSNTSTSSLEEQSTKKMSRSGNKLKEEDEKLELEYIRVVMYHLFDEIYKSILFFLKEDIFIRFTKTNTWKEFYSKHNAPHNNSNPSHIDPHGGVSSGTSVSYYREDEYFDPVIQERDFEIAVSRMFKTDEWHLEKKIPFETSSSSILQNDMYQSWELFTSTHVKSLNSSMHIYSCKAKWYLPYHYKEVLKMIASDTSYLKEIFTFESLEPGALKDTYLKIVKPNIERLVPYGFLHRKLLLNKSSKKQFELHLCQTASHVVVEDRDAIVIINKSLKNGFYNKSVSHGRKMAHYCSMICLVKLSEQITKVSWIVDVSLESLTQFAKLSKLLGEKGLIKKLNKFLMAHVTQCVTVLHQKLDQHIRRRNSASNALSKEFDSSPLVQLYWYNRLLHREEKKKIIDELTLVCKQRKESGAYPTKKPNHRFSKTFLTHGNEQVEVSSQL